MHVQAELSVQDRMKQSELLRAQEELSSVTKEKDRLVKRVKKLENVLRVVQATVPSLEAQKEQQQHNYRRAEDVVRKLQEVCDSLRQHGISTSIPEIHCHLKISQHYFTDSLFRKCETCLPIVCELVVKLDLTFSDGNYMPRHRQHMQAVHLRL